MRCSDAPLHFCVVRVGHTVADTDIVDGVVPVVARPDTVLDDSCTGEMTKAGQGSGLEHESFVHSDSDEDRFS